MSHVVGIDNDHIYISHQGTPWEKRQKIYNKKDFIEAINMIGGEQILSSSSIDFPEDSTDQQWIIDLFKE